MLAKTDQHGRVFTSIPGLAKLAGVSAEATRKAIKTFLEPDPDSRTKDHEGRRICEIDGGYGLLNHAKYRAMRDDDERKEYMREYMREYREKNKSVNNPVNNVNHSKPPLAYTDTDTDTKKNNSANADAFDTFWLGYPRKQDKKKSRCAFYNLSKRNQKAATEDSIVRFSDTDKQFIPLPTTYLHGERWNDESTDNIKQSYAHGAI